jgi:FKBP12-rapamycin complex-associated protein
LQSPLTLELVSFQAKQAFEWLAQTPAAPALISPKQDVRMLAAVLVLRELAANAPTLFNVYVGLFLDVIWTAILRCTRRGVREAAVLALRVCLIDVASRAHRWRTSCWEKIFAHAQAGLQNASTAVAFVSTAAAGRNPRHSTPSPPVPAPHTTHPALTTLQSTACVHGSLLALSELLEYASAEWLTPRFRSIADLVMQHRSHASLTVQRAVLLLWPRIARLHPELFCTTYLDVSIAHIEQAMETDQ